MVICWGRTKNFILETEEGGIKKELGLGGRGFPRFGHGMSLELDARQPRKSKPPKAQKRILCLRITNNCCMIISILLGLGGGEKEPL